MAKLRINGDSSGYVDLEAPNAASSSTLDLDQVPQKNAANTFSTINKFADSVAIGGTHSPSNNLDVRSTGQVIVRVDGSGLYYNGIKIRNNYSSVQSDWNVGAAGGTSGWGSANGTFIIRDDTTNSTGLEIEQGAGSNTAALLIKSSGAVATPNQPAFYVCKGTTQEPIGPTINTAYTITYTSEKYDEGNNFANSTFTAPVTGKYLLMAQVQMVYAETQGNGYILTLNTSNRTFGQNVSQKFSSTPTFSTLFAKNVVDMDAGDTATVSLRYFSVVGSNPDVPSGYDDVTFFSGYLLG